MSIDYSNSYFIGLPDDLTSNLKQTPFTLKTLPSFSFIDGFNTQTKIRICQPCGPRTRAQSVSFRLNTGSTVKVYVSEVLCLSVFTNYIAIYHEDDFFNWIKFNPKFAQFLWNIKDIGRLVDTNDLIFSYLPERFQTMDSAIIAITNRGTMFNFIREDLVAKNPNLKKIALCNVYAENPRTERTIVIGC